MEMGISRRVKIKGCEAVGDVKDGAAKEISGKRVTDSVFSHSCNRNHK